MNKNTIRKNIIQRDAILKDMEYQKRRQEQKMQIAICWNRIQNKYIRLNKKKKYVSQQIKNTEIQRENRILLQKISKIFRNKSKLKQRSQQKQKNKIKKSRVVTQNSIVKRKLKPLNSEGTTIIVNQNDIYYNYLQDNFKQGFQNCQKNKFWIRKKLKNSHQILFEPVSTHKQYLFKGNRIIDQKQYHIEISIYNHKFEFKAQQYHSNVQKILEMSKYDYFNFQKVYLMDGIESFFNYIKIGQKIQLCKLNHIDLMNSNVTQELIDLYAHLN